MVTHFSGMVDFERIESSFRTKVFQNFALFFNFIFILLLNLIVVPEHIVLIKEFFELNGLVKLLTEARPIVSLRDGNAGEVQMNRFLQSRFYLPSACEAMQR